MNDHDIYTDRFESEPEPKRSVAARYKNNGNTVLTINGQQFRPGETITTEIEESGREFYLKAGHIVEI